MLKIMLGLGLACFVVGSGNALYGQAKTSKPKAAPKSSTKSRTAVFTLNWKGKAYKLTCDKSFPWQDINGVFQAAASVPALQRQLDASIAESRRLRILSITSEGLAGDLRDAKDELEEARRELEDSKQELEDTKNELEEAKNELEELKDKVEEVKSAVSDVGFEVGRLKRAIDGFTFLDWKTVVPDVESRFRSLKNEFFTLELKMIGLP